MAAIRTRGTAPELVVRAIIGRLGYRFRTQSSSLPGSPDISNKAKRWVVFVHGCFWHQHASCARASTPRTNREFWRAKLRLNVVRDRSTARALRRMGYTVVVVWQCEVRDTARLAARLARLLPDRGLS